MTVKLRQNKHSILECKISQKYPFFLLFFLAREGRGTRGRGLGVREDGGGEVHLERPHSPSFATLKIPRRNYLCEKVLFTATRNQISKTCEHFSSLLVLRRTDILTKTSKRYEEKNRTHTQSNKRKRRIRGHGKPPHPLKKNL